MTALQNAQLLVADGEKRSMQLSVGNTMDITNAEGGPACLQFPMLAKNPS